MAHKVLNGKQVSSIFIKACAKSMPKRMGGQPVLPAQALFMGGHPTHNIIGMGRTSGIPLGRKEPVCWPFKSEPIFCQDIQSILGKDCIPVGTVLAVSDMNTHVRAFHIRILEQADFPDPQAGRIQERDLGDRHTDAPDKYTVKEEGHKGLASGAQGKVGSMQEGILRHKYSLYHNKAHGKGSCLWCGVVNSWEQWGK